MVLPIKIHQTQGLRAECRIKRLRTGLQTPGLLLVGDGQMSALDTRASLARHQDGYLAPLPLTGATAAMDAWITVGVTKRERGE